MSDSPAVILFDVNGNPVNVVLGDDGKYRLLVDAIASGVQPRVSIANSTTTPLTSLAVFQGTSEDVSEFVSIDVSVLTDQDGAIDGLLFEWSQDNVHWDFTDGGSFSIKANTGQNYSLPIRAKYFRCSYTNGIMGQTTFNLSTVFYAVDRSPYRQNLATDVLAQRSTDVVRAVLAAQKQGGAAQTNNYTNLQSTTGGFLKVSVDTVVSPAVVIPAIVQKRSNGPSVGTSFTDSFLSNTIINNTIIVLVMQGGGSSGATYAFSDSQGNIYTRGASFNNPGVGQIDLWYTNAIGGALTVAAANFSSSSTVGLEIYEVSGLLIGATILDKTIVQTGSGTSLAVGPILTDHDNEFCIAAFVTSGSPSITPGGGWSTDFNAPGFFSESQTQSAAGTITGTATSSISEPYIGVLTTFLPALVSRPIVTDAAGRLITKPQISSGSSTSVGASVSNVTLLTANPNRVGATIFNESASDLYIKLGSTASLTSYTVRLISEAYYETPFNYTGAIDGIWATATGNARITEFT